MRKGFTSAQIGRFFQEGPRLENIFLTSPIMKPFLRRHLPPSEFSEVAGDLEAFGERARGELWDLAQECEANQPRLEQYTPWGKREDRIITCGAWKALKKISIEEGVVGIAYERKRGAYSRLHQMMKAALFHPSSAFVTCPLSMTDGAAKTLEALKRENGSDEVGEAYSRLISTDPDKAWTSGQWMTERGGGSDVANGCETTAYPREGEDGFNLHGYKWFSSAIDADMALTLGRIHLHGAESVKLSLFYLPVRQPEGGSLNGIQVVKLKNKLGTRQLATGELLLDGTRAHLLGQPGRGVANIAHMLAITRVHTAVGAVSATRRMMQMAVDYAKKREAFGKLIMEHALHSKTLAEIEVELRGMELFVFHCVLLQGKEDVGEALDRERLLLRILLPLLKGYVPPRTMQLMTQLLEAFGGQGYIEDTGIPTLFRDNQVNPIWEGTTNIQAHDLVRSIHKTHGEVLQAFGSSLEELTKKSKNAHPSCTQLLSDFNALMKFLKDNPQLLPVVARHLALDLARIYTGALLWDHAVAREGKPGWEVDRAAALRYTAWLPGPSTLKLHGLEAYSENAQRMDQDLLHPVDA